MVCEITVRGGPTRESLDEMHDYSSSVPLSQVPPTRARFRCQPVNGEA